MGAIGGEASHILTTLELPVSSSSVYGVSSSWIGTNDARSVVAAPGTWVNDGSEMYYTGHPLVSIGFSGGGQAHNNMPPFYSLAYIMKL